MQRLRDWWSGLSLKAKTITGIGVFLALVVVGNTGGSGDNADLAASSPTTTAAPTTTTTTTAAPTTTGPSGPSIAFMVAAVDTGDHRRVIRLLRLINRR